MTRDDVSRCGVGLEEADVVAGLSTPEGRAHDDRRHDDRRGDSGGARLKMPIPR